MNASTKPILSLCMIVRDERAHLPRCLESVRGLAGQMVVVDTGSTDGTQEIARERGAEVVESAWTGDFSAARNRGLGRATGNWILVLDADESLGGPACEAIRALIARPPAEAFNLATKSAQASGQHARGQMVRLFPNRPDIRFEFPIHEQVNQSLVRAGIPIRPAEIEIEHWGYATAEELARKIARNRAIIERALREAAPGPLRLHLLYYHACGYYDEGDWARAAEAYTRCLEQSGGVGTKLGRVARLRGAECRFLIGDLTRSRGLLSLETEGEPHPAELCLRGQIETAGGRPEEARAWYEAVLRAPDRAYLPPVALGVLKFKALHFLGRDWAERGRKDLGVETLKLARRIQEGSLDGASAQVAEIYGRIAAAGGRSHAEPEPSALSSGRSSSP
jgi:tetratricopeptide (TPR) repeat protein